MILLLLLYIIEQLVLSSLRKSQTLCSSTPSLCEGRCSFLFFTVLFLLGYSNFILHVPSIDMIVGICLHSFLWFWFPPCKQHEKQIDVVVTGFLFLFRIMLLLTVTKNLGRKHAGQLEDGWYFEWVEMKVRDHCFFLSQLLISRGTKEPKKKARPS